MALLTTQCRDRQFGGGASTTLISGSRKVVPWQNAWQSETSPTRRDESSFPSFAEVVLGGAMAKSPDRAWSAQRMDVPAIAKIAFTSEERVRKVIHNFNADGFDSLAPKYAGGRPPKFTLPERREIKKIALSRPVDHDLPFSTWSLSKLAEFLVAEGVDDISHEGLRVLLREEGVSFQVIKTYKQSTDPDFEAKKNRVLESQAPL
jgi:transposase